MNKTLGLVLKFAASIAFDVADFFIGRIPIFGSIFDLLGVVLAVRLWGWVGSIQGIELLDVSDQVDGFLPTVTIAGVLSLLLRRLGR